MEVFVILAVFSVPLAAILSSSWVKVQKLKLESGGGPETATRLQRLEAENAELRQRVETLETIATTPVGIEGARAFKELEAPKR